MSAKLVMGPVFFHWPAEALRDFYFRLADEAEVDTVCVGEVVCSKRMPYFEDYLPEVIQRLQAAGKDVVLSSLSLMSDKREEALMRELIALAPGLVEANDVAVLRELNGKPHVIGPFINIYNEDALDYLARGGAVRVCLNPEVPGTLATELARRSTVPLEVLVFGRLPLAISARCFHARAEGRTKDGCQFACNLDPDGRVVRTIEDVGFLALNGLQTLSYSCGNLVQELAPMQQAGIQHFRLSPHSGDMVATAKVFRSVLDGRIEAGAAIEQLAALHPDLPFANGFYYAKPGHSFIASTTAEAASRQHG